MLYKTELRGLVVVGGNHQKRINAVFFRLVRELNGILCVVAASACNYGYTSCNIFGCKSYCLRVLLMREGGAFARCAADNNCVRGVFYLKINKLGKLFIVNFVVLIKGGNYRNCRTCKNCFFHAV